MGLYPLQEVSTHVKPDDFTPQRYVLRFDIGEWQDAAGGFTMNIRHSQLSGPSIRDRSVRAVPVFIGSSQSSLAGHDRIIAGYYINADSVSQNCLTLRILLYSSISPFTKEFFTLKRTDMFRHNAGFGSGLREQMPPP